MKKYTKVPNEEGELLQIEKKRTCAMLQRKLAIKEQIISLHFESKQSYGSTRKTFEHANLDYQICRPTIEKDMIQVG